MQAFVTFEGGLVRKGELRQVNTANGSTSVINLTVARNYQKRDGNDWVDDGTYYINCTAWGKIAEAIANSDIPTGFRLIISGVLIFKEKINNIQLLGIFLAILGIVLIAYTKN